MPVKFVDVSGDKSFMDVEVVLRRPVRAVPVLYFHIYFRRQYSF